MCGRAEIAPRIQSPVAKPNGTGKSRELAGWKACATRLARRMGTNSPCAIHECGFNKAMRNPIIAALDVPTAQNALDLARQIAPAVGAFKIGGELFTSAGPDIVHRIRETGAAVFLDLKFHDIPNTVAKSVASATRLDVQMLTIHTSGGLEMMRAAEQSAQKTAQQSGRNAPLVLGVTVLTSHDSNTLVETGCEANVGKQVERLAALAATAGLRGLVCSPLEIVALRQILPSQIQLVTPGIRTGEEKADDQKRTLTPREAIDAGANWLVIGRPIYAAENPRAAAEKILKTLG
jgi:orotidine-5'-phosphate decarboxylase